MISHSLYSFPCDLLQNPNHAGATIWLLPPVFSYIFQLHRWARSVLGNSQVSHYEFDAIFAHVCGSYMSTVFQDIRYCTYIDDPSNTRVILLLQGHLTAKMWLQVATCMSRRTGRHLKASSSLMPQHTGAKCRRRSWRFSRKTLSVSLPALPEIPELYVCSHLRRICAASCVLAGCVLCSGHGIRVRIIMTTHERKKACSKRNTTFFGR
jgi:hypothetical protein